MSLVRAARDQGVAPHNDLPCLVFMFVCVRARARMSVRKNVYLCVCVCARVCVLCVCVRARACVQRTCWRIKQKLSDPGDTTLVFDSLFESGNLYQVTCM